MNIKNNIEIVRLDDLGRGIGYIDKKVVFVPNTLIGEIVNIEILKETSKYYEGIVIEYIKKSDKRIDSICPYFNKCGGCNLLHMSYDEEIVYKKDKLKGILKKFANIDIDINVESNKKVIGYRNKIELKIVNNEWGYYNSNTHDFIKIDKCLLAKDSINEVISHKDLISFNNGTITIKSNYNDEIILVINTDEEIKIDVDTLKKNIKLVGIIVNDNAYYGESFFIEKYDNKLFKVNYNSFFQVNYDMSKVMTNILNENVIGNIILDLYCGVGFLGQSINKKIDKIYGVEINKNSIIDAINNAKINKIDNAYYICSDSSNINGKINDKIDTLIIDPPRSGLVKNMVKDVLNINADKIIYISCNPISLGRDLKELKNSYNIERVYLLDMFSRTYHIESICILKTNNI